MFYYISNAFFGLLVLFLLVSTSWCQKKLIKRLNIKNIIIIAMFVALSVVLTNFIGYFVTVFGVKVMLGNFLIFVCGVLFGPFFGVVAGLCSDVTGSLTLIISEFHFGYMFSKILLGFLGGFVFAPKENRFWKIRLVFFLIVGLSLSSFVVTPIALASVKGWEYTLASYWKKFIIVPSQIVIYTPIVFACINISYLLLKSDIFKPSKPWFLKNNKIVF